MAMYEMNKTFADKKFEWKVILYIYKKQPKEKHLVT